MSFVSEMSFGNIVRLAQADKIIVTIVLTCLLPFGLHALPVSSAPELGQRWLPIFYAPLVAALCCQMHVSLLAAVGGLMLNHYLLGMPSDLFLWPLMFQLVILTQAVVLMRRRAQPMGWSVGAVYLLTLFLSVLIFMPGAKGNELSFFMRSVIKACPGILLLMALTEIVRYSQRGKV